MRLGRTKNLPAVFRAGSSAFGGFKPQILLNITSQKQSWRPAKKSNESNSDLTPSDPFIILYCFLKALLPIPKRRIPAPSRSKVTGQGKGQPKNGLGFPENINIESRINNAPDIIKSHFDVVNMVCLLLLKLTRISGTSIGK